MPDDALQVLVIDEIDEFARVLLERIESAAQSKHVYSSILSRQGLENLRPDYAQLVSADIIFLASAVHDKIRYNWEEDLVALCRNSDSEPAVVIFSGRGEPSSHGADLFISRSDILHNNLDPHWFEALVDCALAKRKKSVGLEACLVASAHESIVTVNERLADLLSRRPDALWGIHPRKFEELIAGLFEEEGYSVVLTPQSRDGGKDLYVFKKDRVANICYVVECKRYRPPRKVGVPVVRQLLGVVQDERVSGGIVVTTSYFTNEAENLALRAPYQLILRNYDDLTDWLQIAGKQTSASGSGTRGAANPRFHRTAGSAVRR